jgi:hypothetical protein
MLHQRGVAAESISLHPLRFESVDSSVLSKKVDGGLLYVPPSPRWLSRQRVKEARKRVKIFSQVM